MSHASRLSDEAPAEDLLTCDATQLSALVRGGEVSAVEVLQAHLARIRAHNREINALVTLDPEGALAAAQRVDAHVRAGTAGPLAGVPVSVKDIVMTARLRTTWGSRLLADHVPAVDAPAIARLRAAGAVIIGKSNCPEFGLDIQTDNALFGATRNPLDPRLTPGGSSGGDSAAVSAGFAALGIGTDYGGSIRWPAQCTGLIGFRPSVGLIPGSGQSPGPWATGPNPFSVQGMLQVIGPLARSVDDAELALRTMAGPDGTDSQAVPVPMVPSRDVDVRQLRYSWLTSEGYHPVRADVAAAVRRVAELLVADGYPIDELDSSLLSPAEELYTRLRSIEGPWSVGAVAQGRTDLLGDPLATWLQQDPPGALPDYLDAMDHRQRLRARVLEQLEHSPILLLPVSAVPAFTLGQHSFEIDGNPLEYWHVLAPSRAISLFGLPAASVPCGLSQDGLPVSVQIVGRPYHDHEVLAVARDLEARQLAPQHPPSAQAVADRPTSEQLRAPARRPEGS